MPSRCGTTDCRNSIPRPSAYWPASRHALGVFEYAPSTLGEDGALEMAGFDCQSGNLEVTAQLGRECLELFDRLGGNALTTSQRKLLADTSGVFAQMGSLGGDQINTVGVTCNRGRVGMAQSALGQTVTTLDHAPPGSFEDLCHRTGHAALFLDLRGLPEDDPLLRPRPARLMGHSAVRLEWPRHLDGLIYIEEMFESTPGGELPDSE